MIISFFNSYHFSKILKSSGPTAVITYITCPCTVAVKLKSIKYLKMTTGGKNVTSSSSLDLKECGTCGASVKDLYNHNYHKHQEKVLPCPVCNKMFKKHATGNLNKHLKSHEAQPTQCDVCDKFVMNIHNHKMSTHSKTKDWQCNICNNKFKTKQILNRHIRNHGKQPQYCDLCDSMVANIYLHRACRHSDENRAKCEKCEKMFHKYKLKEHIARVHDATPVTCDICNSMVKNLNTHNKKVHQEAKYTCNMCDKKFKTNDHLKSHLGKHVNKEPRSSQLLTLKKVVSQKNQVKVACSICLKKFGSNELRYHMKYVHTDSQKVKCTFCDNSFSKGSLDSHISRIHMKRSMEKKTISCSFDDCEKLFRNKSEMTSHAKSHSNARPFECKMCEKSYKQSMGLVGHMRLHTGERPFKCPTCSFDCTDPAVLKRHQAIHLGLKPFQCDFCSNSFKNKGELGRHTNDVHTKLRAVNCEHCGKLCVSKQELNRHTKYHHTNEWSHVCSQCDKSF